MVLGIVIGGGAYGIYRHTSQKSGSQTFLKEEQVQPTAVQTPKSLEPTIAKSTTATPKLKEQEQGKKPESTIAKGNFSREGAVMAREEGWILLWDEPGRMAMNVKLKFTDQSVCILGGEEKDCALINMGPQSYDRVKVEGNRTGDEVTVTKLEELKLP